MNNLFSRSSEQRTERSRAERRPLHDYLTFSRTWPHSTSSLPPCLTLSQSAKQHTIFDPPSSSPPSPSLPSDSLLAQCPATFKQFRLLKAYAAHFTLNHTNKCHFIQQIFAASSSKGGRSGKNIGPHTSQGTHILAHTHTGRHAHTHMRNHTHPFAINSLSNKQTGESHTHTYSRRLVHTLPHTHTQTSTHTHTGTLARYTHACRNTQSSFHYKTEVHRSSSSSSSPKHKNTHTHSLALSWENYEK